MGEVLISIKLVIAISTKMEWAGVILLNLRKPCPGPEVEVRVSSLVNMITKGHKMITIKNPQKMCPMVKMTI